MNKRLLVATLAVASLLLATGAFATTSYCTGGANLRFVGVGSSAQTNALAYAATALLQSNHGTGTYALISFSGSTITDSRPKSGAKTDTGITTWVAYDPSATTSPCDAYVYYQTDSGVGVKDFFAYTKFTATNSTVSTKKNFVSIGAASATLPSAPISEGNKIPGLADGCFISGSSVACDSNGVPTTIYNALNTSPSAYVNQTVPPRAPAYCGNVSTVVVTSQFYCYFNAAGTDVRPEDALYATTRALAAYNGIVPPAKGATSTETLTGLGYGTTSTSGCTADADQPTLVGCGIWDSFTQNSQFNVVKFALGGTDPIASGTAPTYTTVSVGAVPVMVLAGNEDSSNLGSTGCNSTYCYTDINRQVLAQVFSGYTQCVADLSTSAAPGTLASGAAPLQVIHREPLSGTYNTFEFTAVNTQAGGPGRLVSSKYTPPKNASSGQEQFNDPAVFPGYTGSTDCSYSSGEVVGTHPGFPNANCFNPRYTSYDGVDIFSGSQCQGAAAGVAPGLPVHLRAIGTGMAVKAVIGSLNVTSGTIPNTNVFNPIGYAFWSYANLNPLCSSVSNTACTGTWLAHYLTVDGIDPLFTTEGGQYDPTPNPSPFNPPVCKVATGSTADCNPVPFTHVYDGKYPLWSLLRTVTLAPVTGKVATPQGVLDIVAQEEISSANNTLSDYVPFLKHVCPPGQVWTQPNGPCASSTTTTWTGDLNLFVFRSHFERTGATIAPANGHFYLVSSTKTLCGTTEINLQGGNKSSSTCFVDFGSDVGGSVLTVQKDFDFIIDFNTEEYGLSQ